MSSWSSFKYLQFPVISNGLDRTHAVDQVLRALCSLQGESLGTIGIFDTIITKSTPLYWLDSDVRIDAIGG